MLSCYPLLILGDCNLMRLDLEEPETADRSFTSAFKISSDIPPDCEEEFLKRIIFALYGPFNKQDPPTTIPPTVIQTVDMPIDECFQADDDGRLV